MGSSIISFPRIDGTVVIDWNDVNLRLNYITWSVGDVASIRVRVYRVDISPDAIYDEIIECPASDAEPLPGNMVMVEAYDPDIGDYLAWPEGLVFRVSVLP